MKKTAALFALALALFAATSCDVNEMSTLRDISRPYAGEYQCKKLQLGGEDLLPRFEFIKLKLDAYGKFALSYADCEGGESGYSGGYRIEDGEITFTAAAEGAERSYVFPYDEGTVRIRLLMGEKLLYAEFSAV